MTNIEIGKITKPQGVKGEFRLRPNTINYESFSKLTKLQINSKVYSVEHISLRNGFVVVKVKGIDDRNTVESIVGSSVRIDAQDSSVSEDDVLDIQIIGCTLYDEKGRALGDIVNIANYGAGEVYTIMGTGSKEFMFPNVRGVITSIDVNLRKVVVNSDILNEIIVE